MANMSKTRCSWCGDDPLYVRYHDKEWGVPLHDDRKLFELLMLEGAQAGLSWITVLRKRENYRAAFDKFDPRKLVRYNEADIERLLANPGIVRNRLKVQSAAVNARAYLDIVAQQGSFDGFLWQFVDGKPIGGKRRSMRDVPASTIESDRMSKELKKRGFKFVGSTICYAFMQAAGMVNDHLVTCYRHREIQRLL
jgi:DNA-3-methyladenine glycosylase I